MITDPRTLDLHTLNVAIEAAARSVQEKGIHWELQSANAAFSGQLQEALTCKHWAFAATILAPTVRSALTALFIQAVDVKIADLMPCSDARSASAQEAPVINSPAA